MPTVSFTFTAAEATRIQVAVGHILNLGRNATAEEARQFIIGRIKKFVLDDEREAYLAQHASTQINPT